MPADRRSPERLQTMSHWRTEIECHAAFQEGGAELDWGRKGITADDAKWIASALANPAVRSTCNPHSVRDGRVSGELDGQRHGTTLIAAMIQATMSTIGWSGCSWFEFGH